MNPDLRLRTYVVVAALGAVAVTMRGQTPAREWLPGDSHVHSHWSPGYNRKVSPPEPIRGGDARYSTPQNARMAFKFGLAWMVTTDHGGPNHAKLNLTQAYPELQSSRRLVPEVIQFYGMELNLPGMDHHTLIIPRSEEEAATLQAIESRFDANETWPVDRSRSTEAARLAALTYINGLPRLPLLFANHPSRSAKGVSAYGLDEPWEIRQNIDAAPEVYRGMEGGPGHQAGTLARDRSPKLNAQGRFAGSRGGYGNPGAHTLGGFDQMTAIVGGLWDSLLGEGRRFWIVASSDSHVHYTEAQRPGSDFWPGEFHKTYVLARKTHDDILDGLRAGRIFVSAGGLITSLDVTASSGGRNAGAGDTLTVERGEPVTVTIRFRDPGADDGNDRSIRVNRVDLITGAILGPASHRSSDRNETSRVVDRFARRNWSQDGDVYEIVTTLPPLTVDSYLRIRGTNTDDFEPTMDQPGESPWSDLWFYSNPIFLELKSETTRRTHTGQ